VSLKGIGIGPALLAAVVCAIILNTGGWLSDRMLDLIFLVSIAWMAFRAFKSRFGRTLAASIALSTMAALAALQSVIPTLRYFPYLAIIPANVLLAIIFARGLMPGQRPVLLQLVEIIGMAPVDDAAFQKFVARQCAVWSVLTLLTALVSFGATVDVAARPSLSRALNFLIASQIIWFGVSHHYASLRYGRPERWWITLKTLARQDVWSRLGRP